ncbi:MAG: phosphoribosylglycinamide formyltransferase [Planctomycetota bacterium]
MTSAPLPVAVFLSGGGRTLSNLIDQRDQGRLDVDLRVVISSKPSAGGVAIANAAGIETRTVVKSTFAGDEDYCQAMFDPCRQHGVKLVVMAGFLKHVLIPEDFRGRVINIHPSLLPEFGGQGMYGAHVHRAVINAGAGKSGCTVHFVDNVYDNGPPILQLACDVDPSDTAESLAAKVFQLECRALPKAIRLITAQLN